MMSFLNNMNLLPKNFIVANAVELLKEDPDNGVDKLYEMAGTFITDPQVKAIVDQIKVYYDTHPSVKRYVKNMLYNTNKTCLNHFIQNVGVKELWEGLSTREDMSKKHGVAIPHAIVLNVGMNSALPCKGNLGAKQQVMMPISEIGRFVQEAHDLGIHVIVLVGGDPFTNDRLFKIYETYSDMEFIVLTDGILLDESTCQKLSELGNVLPLITLEGTANEVTQFIEPTSYQKILSSLDRLKSAGVLFGVVSPTTALNMKSVTSDEFLLPLIRKGSRMNWYVITKQTKENEQFTEDSLSELEERISFIRQTRPYVTVLLESTNPFECRHVVGGLRFHYHLGEQVGVLTFPQVTAVNSNKLPLVEVIRMNS